MTFRLGGVVEGWCERGDLNPHGLLRQILSLVRLPISPLSLFCNAFRKSFARAMLAAVLTGSSRQDPSHGSSKWFGPGWRERVTI